MVDGTLRLLSVTLDSDGVAVDLGCGIGRITRALAHRVRLVKAVDVSDEMLALARQHNADLANVDWILGDGCTLGPIADASVDACFSHVTLQHVPDPEVTLGYVSEMGRVLRRGGFAAFQVSNDPAVHRRRRLGPLQAIKAAAGWAPRGRRHAAWLGAPVELSGVRRAAADGGMEVERVLGAGTQFCLVLARRL